VVRNCPSQNLALPSRYIIRTGSSITSLSEAVQGKLGKIETLIPFLGKDFELPEEEGKVEGLGFVINSFSNSDGLERVDEITKLETGTKEIKDGVLVSTLDSGASVVHIIQKSYDREIGDPSILIIAQDEKFAGSESYEQEILRN
jgi:hypothetical protein